MSDVKFVVTRCSTLGSDVSADTMEAAITLATSIVLGDSSKRPVTIFKAVKVVRIKDSPVTVEDLAA